MAILTYWLLMAVLLSCLGCAARIVWLAAERRAAAMASDRGHHAGDSEQRYDPVAGERWLSDARVKALWLAETGDVTTDDIWKVCPPPASVDGRLVSKVFDRAEWEIVGYRHSERGRNNARQIAVWRRKKAEAA